MSESYNNENEGTPYIAGLLGGAETYGFLNPAGLVDTNGNDIFEDLRR